MTEAQHSLTVGLADAADQVGLTYDYLQRHWRRMVDEEGFPQPYKGNAPGAHPRWLRAPLIAWMERRSGASPSVPVTQLDRAGTAANDVEGDHVAVKSDVVDELLTAAGGG